MWHGQHLRRGGAEGGPPLYTSDTEPQRGRFAKIIRRVADAYPEAETIHLVVDNLNTHTRESSKDYFGPDQGGALWDRFALRYTPTHGSWLNQAEIELNLVAGETADGHTQQPPPERTGLEPPCESTKAENRMDV